MNFYIFGQNKRGMKEFSSIEEILGEVFLQVQNQ